MRTNPGLKAVAIRLRLKKVEEEIEQLNQMIGNSMSLHPGCLPEMRELLWEEQSRLEQKLIETEASQ